MTRRTDDELALMIKAIEYEYSQLPHYSAFGDDNWKARDDLVDLLKCIVEEDLDEEGINDLVEDIWDSGTDDDLAMSLDGLAQWVLGEQNDWVETLESYKKLETERR